MIWYNYSWKLILCLLIIPAAAKYQWNILQYNEEVNSNSALGAREGQAAANYEENIYSFGGVDNNGKLYDDLYAFHPSTKSWNFIEIKGENPPARKEATLTKIHNYLLLFGGTNNKRYFSDTFLFDISDEKWLLGEFIGADKPASRSGHCSATDGSGRVFIFGGYGNEVYLNDLWVIDTNVDLEYINISTFPLVAQRVKTEGKIPSAREGCSLTYANNKLYLIGGYGSDGLKSNNIWIFDLSHGKWQSLASIGAPAPREGHVAARNGNEIILLGGCNTGRASYRCFNDVWSYNIDRNKWFLLNEGDNLFIPRGNHAAFFTSGSRLITFGGSKLGAYLFGDVLEFTGISPCDEKTNNCSQNGKCLATGCSCSIGFGGHDCGEKLSCPNNCHGHGICTNGSCVCYPGYFGRSCFIPSTCPGYSKNGPCNGNGACLVDNSCHCKNGYFGKSCEFEEIGNLNSAIQTNINKDELSNVSESSNIWNDIQNYTNDKLIPLTGTKINVNLNNNDSHKEASKILRQGFYFEQPDYNEETMPHTMPLFRRILMACLCLLIGKIVIFLMIGINSKRMASGSI